MRQQINLSSGTQKQSKQDMRVGDMTQSPVTVGTRTVTATEPAASKLRVKPLAPLSCDVWTRSVWIHDPGFTFKFGDGSPGCFGHLASKGILSASTA
eukprot:3221365-Rhodomonas_salina.1